MPVVDASAMLEAIAAPAPGAALMKRLASEDELHVPHLFELEVLSGLRRLQAAGQLPEPRAGQARRALRALPLIRHEHEPLHERIWALRDNLTVYDATYIALAERLRLPLVTTDARLARAPTSRARLELFAPGD